FASLTEAAHYRRTPCRPTNGRDSAAIASLLFLIAMIKRLIKQYGALKHGAETMASISMRRVQKAYGEHAPVIRDVDLE
ncbi:hypothetical protein NGF31_003212, partial [Listeria monocytogenes]|nr:hypothetical protein [Listeria monocytogenes]